MTAAEVIRAAFWWTMIICAYIVPAAIARKRRVANFGSVVVINLLLGWTVAGWAVALAMACRDVPKPPPAASRRWPDTAPDGSRESDR
jgi:Superinfection immunity protein